MCLLKLTSLTLNLKFILFSERSQVAELMQPFEKIKKTSSNSLYSQQDELD